MELLNKLEQTKDDTLTFFVLEEQSLNKTYSSGKWTVRFILHHLTDVETVLFDRIRRIISNPQQVIQAFDQDAWANKLGYEQRPLELSKRIYSSARDGIIYYADNYASQCGNVEFVHSQAGVRSLKDEFAKVASHNQHHLDQIHRALKTET